SMPGPHYKNNRKLEKSKGQKLCFITTLMPFEERHMYKHEGTPDLDVSPLMDTKSIVDGDGNVIGQIGIQLIDEGYKLPEKPETSDLMALYNQVSLGNDFHFDVHDSYIEVRNDTTEIVGTTDVYISPAINSDTEEHDYGILAYKRGDSCYLGIILLRDAVTAEQWKDVARHVTLA
ncbi:hypothetical protein, partial [Candidatus Weimeria sp. HCP3S3_B5]|uniref:hypothetical protein n=1 Tax=Candidatus Weimeria sp. HCP3S3_B5 TaxID=3438871 RepID=UPI003F8B05AF